MINDDEGKQQQQQQQKKKVECIILQLGRARNFGRHDGGMEKVSPHNSLPMMHIKEVLEGPDKLICRGGKGQFDSAKKSYHYKSKIYENENIIKD